MTDIKINTLVNEEKYEDAIDLMRDKYVGLFSKMLDKRNCTKPENDDFYCYATRIMSEYPELNTQINALRNGMLDEDLSFLDEMELLKNTYKSIEEKYV